MSVAVGGTVAFGIADWVNAGIFEAASPGGLALSAHQGDMKFQTHFTRTRRMTITNAGGLVGIATPTPGALLHVAGKADEIQFIAQANATQSGNILEVQDSAGTAQIVVDPNYRLGIGYATPGVPLDVRGVALIGDQAESIGSGTHLQIARNNDPIMAFRHLNAAAVSQLDYTNYYFKDTGGTERVAARIAARHATTHASQPGAEIRLATADAGGSLTEHFFLDENGNVGVNDATPGDTFTVDGAITNTGVVDDGNSGATKTLDWTTGNSHKLTLTAACTLTMTATAGSARCILRLIQDGTGGWAVTWPSNVKLAGGAYTVSVGAGNIDTITFDCDGTDFHEVSRSLLLA